MIDILRFHERSEANQRIINPLGSAKLDRVGEICEIGPEHRILDLGCGKGEMLCRWGERYGASGHGVDISEVFLDAARERAVDLGVTDRVTFVRQDAAEYVRDTPDLGRFDIVSCLGASWIGGGIAGTLDLMGPVARPEGTILIGEPFWNEPPSAELLEIHQIAADTFTDLAGTVQRCMDAGFEVVDMVISAPDDWDVYIASQWRAVHSWVRDNPEHPDVAGMMDMMRTMRDGYLRYERRQMGWGVFVLRR